MNFLFYSSFALSLCCFYACTSTRQTATAPSTETSLRFIEEYVIPSNTFLDHLEIGGLSGISFHNGMYYLISDDPRTPRFFTADIQISEKGIDTILFKKATKITDSNKVFDKEIHLDLEDIHLWNPDTLIFIGEGAINKAIDPTLLITNINGAIQEQFELPNYFSSDPKYKNHPRHNGVFEGLTPSYDHKGVWVATELPLLLDGPEPTFKQKGAPVRITYFDYFSKKATTQFAYPLDPLSKDPKGAFGVNGVTALLQLDKQTFWILERTYSEGYGNQGTSAKLYEVSLQKTTNTLNIDALEGQKIHLASKKLLFDFETIRPHLTANSIDNIEGITFGPPLPDGSQSVLFVADNNFHPPTIQINQVLLYSFKK